MARITAFSDLFPFAHAMVPGCPEPLFTQHILQAARKYCLKSRVWRPDLDSYDLVDGTKEYTLAPTVSTVTYAARIDVIVEVRWNSETGVTNGDKGAVINWRDYSFNPNTNVLTFDTAPTDDVTSGLDVQAVLVPHLSASDLPDWVLNNYAEAIQSGALASLLKIPQETWTDKAEAEAQRLDFRNWIAKAKADIAAEYRDGSIGGSS